MEEVWREIPGYNGLYLASTHGKIKSTDMLCNNTGYKDGVKATRIHKGKELKCCSTTPKGYARVNLLGKVHMWHRIIALTFIDNLNNLSQINHKDGNKLNNNVNNLEWCDNKYNRSHAVYNRLHAFGSKIGEAKLIESDINPIRKLLKTLKIKDIAAMYGVSNTTISDIKHGRTWKHV